MAKIAWRRLILKFSESITQKEILDHLKKNHPRYFLVQNPK